MGVKNETGRHLINPKPRRVSVIRLDPEIHAGHPSRQDAAKQLPGVLETFARAACPVSILMRDDLPTFERPMTANSGSLGCGHCAMLVLLFTNSAFFTRTCVEHSLSCQQTTT